MFFGGHWEARAGRMFSATFGVVYAGFLLTTAIILRFFAADVVAQAGPRQFGHAFGAYLLLWCALTAVLTVVSTKVNWPAFLAFLFLALALLFAGLAAIAGTQTGAGDALNRTSGWLGLIDAALAWYLAAAILVNDTFARAVLPIPTLGNTA